MARKKYIEEFIKRQDRFYVQEVPLAGSKETVYRVMDRITKDSAADFMKIPKGYGSKDYKKIRDMKVESLDKAEKILLSILKDPKLKHRWEKTRIDLNHIRTYKKSLLFKPIIRL